MPYEKVGKNDPVCIADEVPFDIPDSWEWVRLSAICSFIGGYAFKSTEYKSEGVRIIRISDFDDKGLLYKEYKYYSLKPELEKYTILANDILVCMTGGTVGKACLLKNITEKMYLNQRVAGIRRMSEEIDADYLYTCIICPYIKDIILTSKTSTNDNISMDTISSFLIPIPPVDEQIRIVQILCLLQHYIENYDIKYNELTSLNDLFPELFKKSILQHAVMGKLVPQDPNDEPASVLLERIRAEKQELIKAGKLKKDKHESIIYRRDNSHYEKLDGVERCIDDEIPFEIPETWEWVRLGIIFQHNTGKALNSSNREGKSLTYITTSNLYWNRFELDNLRQMYFTESEIKKCTITKGDLLVCEGGDIGRAAIWMYDYKVRIQNHIHRLRSYSHVCTEYFYYLFYLYKHSGVIGGKGIGIQGLSSNALHNILFPLPPLNEQYRIVEAINAAIIPINKL